jgi:acyl-CoA reductase-like NAD-dependent aldehyde dehydrogenase
LIHDRRIRAIKFCGETANGKIIAEQSGLAMKKEFFELGSNDAFVVLDDADVDAAVDAAYESRMFNSG